MTAPFDRLHADLADLAEEVTVVNLQDRVLRTSRQLGMRRTLVGGAAVLAVLAAASGTALAVLPQQHDSVPPAVITSQSASPPAPSASSSPTPDAPPSTGTPSAPPTSASPPNASATMPALYFYRLDRQDGALKNDLSYRPAGGAWRVVSALPQPPGTTPSTLPRISLSPDRRSMAWVTADGKLQVSAVDGTGLRTLGQSSPSFSCGWGGITWTGDSRRIVYVEHSAVQAATDTIKVVNASGSGARTLASIPAGTQCSVHASGDGRTVAYLDQKNNKVDLLPVDGGGQHAMTLRLPSGQVSRALIAVSPDGQRLLISTVSRQTACGCSPPQRYYLVGVGSGDFTRLDQDGTAPISGGFTDDGRVVLVDDLNRDNGNGVVPRLTLFGPDGSVLGHAAAPDFTYGYLVTIG